MVQINILPNISKSKFGQLIADNKRNIFLEKSYTISGKEASPRPFHKKSKFRISLDQKSEML